MYKKKKWLPNSLVTTTPRCLRNVRQLVLCAHTVFSNCLEGDFSFAFVHMWPWRTPLWSFRGTLRLIFHFARSYWCGRGVFSANKSDKGTFALTSWIITHDQVASICAQSAPEARPTMLDVVEMLKEPSKISPTKALPEEGKTPQTSETVKHHEPAVMEGPELKST